MIDAVEVIDLRFATRPECMAVPITREEWESVKKYLAGLDELARAYAWSKD